MRGWAWSAACLALTVAIVLIGDIAYAQAPLHTVVVFQTPSSDLLAPFTRRYGCVYYQIPNPTETTASPPELTQIYADRIKYLDSPAIALHLGTCPSGVVVDAVVDLSHASAWTVDGSGALQLKVVTPDATLVPVELRSQLFVDMIGTSNFASLPPCDGTACRRYHAELLNTKFPKLLPNLKVLAGGTSDSILSALVEAYVSGASPRSVLPTDSKLGKHCASGGQVSYNSQGARWHLSCQWPGGPSDGQDIDVAQDLSLAELSVVCKNVQPDDGGTLIGANGIVYYPRVPASLSFASTNCQPATGGFIATQALIASQVSVSAAGSAPMATNACFTPEQLTVLFAMGIETTFTMPGPQVTKIQAKIESTESEWISFELVHPYPASVATCSDDVRDANGHPKAVTCKPPLGTLSFADPGAVLFQVLSPLRVCSHQ